MKKFNLLDNYPKPQTTRKVNTQYKNISHKLLAINRGKEFFDGKRNIGYGGYNYDGRWIPIAKKLIKKFKLRDGSKILHINCEKGYLLFDLKNINNSFKISGLETSRYAVSKAPKKIKNNIRLCNSYSKLNYKNKEFDLIICFGAISYHGLKDAVALITEIKRVSKNKSFINLASFKTDKDYWLMRDWTVLGNCILSEKEWLKILQTTDYKGHYDFINAQTLNLKRI